MYKAFSNFYKNKLERKMSIKNQIKITRWIYELKIETKKYLIVLLISIRFIRRAHICERKP